MYLNSNGPIRKTQKKNIKLKYVNLVTDKGKELDIKIQRLFWDIKHREAL